MYEVPYGGNRVIPPGDWPGTPSGWNINELTMGRAFARLVVQRGI